MELLMNNSSLENEYYLNQPSWQFNVLYIFGVVIKYPKSRNQRISAIKASRLGKSITKDKLNSLIFEITISQKESLAILANSTKLGAFCGKPYCLYNLIFQKKGETFLSARSSHSLIDLINRFFVLNQEIWKIGVCEGTFDFLRNCGILPNGESFFIDLGNFSTNFNKFCKILKEERWKYRLDYLSLNTKEKDYFDSLASKFFSVNCFKSFWRSNIGYE